MTATHQASFSSGEITPLLHGRNDQALFHTALKTCRNFFVRIQGGVSTTPGTKFIGALGDETAPGLLVPFSPSRELSYQIEFGSNQKMRFYRADQLIRDTGGDPFEIDHPYNDTELARLQWAQSADVMYLVSGGQRTARKLEHFGDTDWVLTPARFEDGPFLPQNIDKNKTIKTDGIEGIITLTASGFTFDAGHANSIWKLIAKDLNDVPLWEGGVDSAGSDIEYAKLDRVRVGANVYERQGSETLVRAGPNAPTHTEGQVRSAKNSCVWKFLHAGFGIVRILDVAVGGVTATARVLTELPVELTATASFKFEEGSFSRFRGYPGVIGWFEQRLMLGATDHQPTTVFGSVSSDFQNMLAGTDDDDALQYTIVSRNLQVNHLLWFATSTRLMLGSSGDEFTLGASSFREALTPTNVSVRDASGDGSTAVPALQIDGRALFLGAGGLRLHELGFSIKADDYKTEEVSLQADHLFLDGCTGMTWARDPYRILWVIRSDGTLIGVTYMRKQQVVGFHTADVGGDGFIERLSVSRSPDGERSELWMIVRRTVDGATRRYIERQEFALDYREEGKPDRAWYLCSGVRYDETNGPPTDTVTGLDHLEGETVEVLADGAVLPDEVVESGTITLDRTYQVILVGLPVNGRKFESLDPNFADNRGATAGRQRRVRAVVTRTLGSAGGIIYRSDTPEEFEQIRPSGGGDYDEARDTYAGVRKTRLIGGWDREAGITIEQNQPLPMTVLEFTTEYNIAGEGG
ncbi:MAG: hypothetical protein V3W41_22425 [Planctomycetota bacterium]